MDRWTKFAKQTYAIEQQYHPLFLKISTAFRSSLINSIRTNGLQATRDSLNGIAFDESLGPTLQSLYRKAGKAGARMTYNELKKEIREGRKGALYALQTKDARFGLNERWIADVLDYLKANLLSLAFNISDTMRSDALKIISKGIEEGWSITTITDALLDLKLQRVRARTIARTEITRAVNVGHQIGAASIPYELNKKWVSAKDHRRRHAHRAVEGHTTDEAGTFKVPMYKGDVLIGYEEMDGPGDPKASAGNIINCRCRKIFEPKRDGHGNLIPRTGTPARIIPLRPTQFSGSPSQIAAALKKAITISVD